MRSNILLRSFAHALGALAYIAAVAWLLSHGQNIFGQEHSFLVPLFMLLLFVISAAATGILVLGRPAQLYLEGEKKTAWTMLFSTLGWMAVFLLIVVAMALLKR